MNLRLDSLDQQPPGLPKSVLRDTTLESGITRLSDDRIQAHVPDHFFDSVEPVDLVEFRVDHQRRVVTDPGDRHQLARLLQDFGALVDIFVEPINLLAECVDYGEIRRQQFILRRWQRQLSKKLPTLHT